MKYMSIFFYQESVIIFAISSKIGNLFSLQVVNLLKKSNN